MGALHEGNNLKSNLNLLQNIDDRMLDMFFQHYQFELFITSILTGYKI